MNDCSTVLNRVSVLASWYNLAMGIGLVGTHKRMLSKLYFFRFPLFLSNDWWTGWAPNSLSLCSRVSNMSEPLRCARGQARRSTPLQIGSDSRWQACHGRGLWRPGRSQGTPPIPAHQVLGDVAASVKEAQAFGPTRPDGEHLVEAVAAPASVLC